MMAVQAAPWAGFVLLAEFTALLFLRFSNQSIALQRYFTEGLAQLRDRHLAMRFIVEFGTPEEVVSAAQKMLAASNKEIKLLDNAKRDENLLQDLSSAVAKGSTKEPRKIKRSPRAGRLDAGPDK